MSFTAKNWDHRVADTEALARSAGFQQIRDRLITRAAPRGDDVVVDVGAGTGLLTLALAPRVRRVWAVDISSSMTHYLATKARSADLWNVELAQASAVSLPLMDGTASLVVSNYCYHHLRDEDKHRALAEAFRVLRPGGRVVVGDMMFRMQLGDRRTRRVLTVKMKAMLGRGPRGAARLMRNAGRYVTRRWEHPADAGWWERALARAGFMEIEVVLLDHEGGIVSARRPGRALSAPPPRLAASPAQLAA